MFFVLTLVCLSACRPPISIDGIFPDPVPIHAGTVPGITGVTSGNAEKLLPEHRRILEITGWYNYVSSNIDSIEYYPWNSFSHPNGPAIGMATQVNGIRTAYIALNNRSDSQVCETIVHEAAHLAGIAQRGQMFGEEEAQAVAARFWRKWLSVSQRYQDLETN